MIIDTELLHEQIISATLTDLNLQAQVGLNDRWTKDDNGLIRLNGHIFVPDVNDLQLRVLKAKHDHPTAGHFGQHKTLKLI